MPQRYRYEPSTGLAYLQSGDMEGPGIDPLGIMGGRYTVQGYQVVDARTRQVYENLGRSGDINITVMDNGVVDITSRIARSTLNAAGPRFAAYGISGPVEFLAPDGSPVTVNVELSSITGYGERVFTYLDANDIRRYEAVKPGSLAYNELLNRSGGTGRWATGREAAEAALISWVGRNMSRLVNDYLNAGGMMGPDGWEDTASGIVRALAKMTSDSFLYNKGVRITSRGDIAGG